MQAEGLEPIAADFQSLYAALLLVSRNEDGRFPERADDAAYILGMVEYIRSTIARRALADDMPVVATISERPDGARYRALAALLGGAAREETIDPGVDEIVRRLGERNGTVSSQCMEAISRWYDTTEIEEANARRMAARIAEGGSLRCAGGWWCSAWRRLRGIAFAVTIRNPGLNVLEKEWAGMQCHVAKPHSARWQPGLAYGLARARNGDSQGLTAAPHRQELPGRCAGLFRVCGCGKIGAW